MNLFELLFLLFHLGVFVTAGTVVALDEAWGWMWALPAGVLAVAVSLCVIYGFAWTEFGIRRLVRRGVAQTRTAPAIDAMDPAMLILISGPPTREAFLAAFWQWVAILAEHEPARASAALWWARPPRDPEALARQILTFWKSDRPWHVIVPNDRLIAVVNDAADVSIPSDPRWGDGRVGWGMAQVPVTDHPDRAKDDDVPLMGVAVSFFLKEVSGRLALEFEIVHV